MSGSDDPSIMFSTVKSRARACLTDRPPRREDALALLAEAGPVYHRAQIAYQALLDQATSLLVDGRAREAQELQDHLNALYATSRTGPKLLEVDRIDDSTLLKSSV